MKQRNPPTKGFYDELGHGAYTTAWSNGQGKVELIVNTSSSGYTDLGKEALLQARQRLLADGDKAAASLLPDLQRLRIDQPAAGGVEFVYSSPRYQPLDKQRPSDCPAYVRELVKLDLGSSFVLGAVIERIEAASAIPAVERAAIAKALTMVAACAQGINRRHPQAHLLVRADLQKRNLALGAQASLLILLDPVMLRGPAAVLAAEWGLAGVKQRNPPSANFDVQIGEGAFATAHRGPGERVEVIIWEQPGAAQIDISKDLLLQARQALLAGGDGPAAAFLPALQRKRLDREPLTDTKQLAQFIYEEPLYTPLNSDGLQLDPESFAAHVKAIAELRHFNHLAQVRSALQMELGWHPDTAHLLRALDALEYVAEDLQAQGGRAVDLDVAADFEKRNLAVDKAGHLILLDPIYVYAPRWFLEQQWAKFGMKNTGFEAKAPPPAKPKPRLNAAQQTALLEELHDALEQQRGPLTEALYWAARYRGIGVLLMRRAPRQDLAVVHGDVIYQPGWTGCPPDPAALVAFDPGQEPSDGAAEVLWLAKLPWRDQ